MWCPPTISLKWGSYFAPDTDDDTKIVDAAIKAHDAGLVTLRSAVQKVQRPFNIENVDQFLVSLEEERQAKQDQLAADMHAMGGAADDETTDGSDPKESKVAKSAAGKVTKTVVPKKAKKPAGE